jgi:hypothetical protein
MSNFDQRVALFQGAGAGGGFKSSANAATRGRGGGSRHQCLPQNSKGKGSSSGNSGSNNARSGGGRPSCTNNKGRRNNSSSNSRSRPDTVRCQICGKPGHSAKDCWYRFEEDDDDSSQDEKVVGAAEASYGVDINWYVEAAPRITSPASLKK